MNLQVSGVGLGAAGVYGCGALPPGLAPCLVPTFRRARPHITLLLLPLPVCARRPPPARRTCGRRWSCSRRPPWMPSSRGSWMWPSSPTSSGEGGGRAWGAAVVRVQAVTAATTARNQQSARCTRGAWPEALTACLCNAKPPTPPWCVQHRDPPRGGANQAAGGHRLLCLRAQAGGRARAVRAGRRLGCVCGGGAGWAQALAPATARLPGPLLLSAHLPCLYRPAHRPMQRGLQREPGAQGPHVPAVHRRPRVPVSEVAAGVRAGGG